MQNVSDMTIFIIQGLLGLVVFFGGMWVRDLAQAVKDLRMQDQELSERIASTDKANTDRMNDYVRKDEFRDFRADQNEALKTIKEDQRNLFRQVFDKLDSIVIQVSNKADRSEMPRFEDSRPFERGGR